MILIKKGQTNNISVSVSLNSTLNSPYYLFRFTQIMSKDTITFIPKVILLSDRYDEFQFIEDSSVDLSADPPKVYFRYEGQYWVEIYENCDGSLDVDQSRLVWDGRAEVMDDCPPEQYWEYISSNEDNANFIFLNDDEICQITPSPTASPTITPTNTQTPTQTQTQTPTNTPTPSITASQTATSTPTQTPSETPTNTPTQTPTQTPTNTQTYTPTNTPTQTQTQTPTNTPTQTQTNTPTQTPTQTPTNTQTGTPTNTPTQTQTQTPTNTPTQTQTNTPTNTPSNTPTTTQTQTPSPTPTKIAVCPEQFEMTEINSQAGLVGTHTRQYSASTQNFNYAYIDLEVSPGSEVFTFGTAPDSKNYPLFQYYDALNGWYSTALYIHAPSYPNLANKWWIWSGTSNILVSGTRDGVANTFSTGFTEINGVQFPVSGCLQFPPSEPTYCFNYTEICPSPTPTNTPTNTSTSTQTPTPTPTPTIPLSGTTEANAYLEAVVQAGGTVDATMSAATRTLFTSIVSNGLWDKLYKMYPYLGGVAASHSLEGKTAVSEISWNGGITHDANGVQGNGSNGYGDTGINANTLLTPTTSTSAGIYVNANGAGNNIYDMGVEHPSIALADMFNLTAKRSAGTGNNTLFDAGTYPNGRVETTSQADALGMTIGTIRAAADRELYRNGSSIQTSTTSHTPAYASRNIFVLAQNSTSGANYYSNHRHAFCFIGQGLDDTDVSNLSTIINTYQTALGRNTY